MGNNQNISQSFPKLLQEIERINQVDIAQSKSQVIEKLDANLRHATKIQDFYKFIFVDNDLPDEDMFQVTKDIKLRIMAQKPAANYTKIIILL